MTWTRRHFILTGTAAGASAYLAKAWWWNGLAHDGSWHERVFIGKAADYNADLRGVMLAGFRELGIGPDEIRGKRVLLKPNIVEPHIGHPQITTNPAVVRAAIEAFLGLGASAVLLAEGPGHVRDTFAALEVSGMREILREDRIAFGDLNYLPVTEITNAGGRVASPSLFFPALCRDVDWIVSMPKMKTHHWMGVTLAMKNLFGLMPGSVYGWPKNAFHFWGIGNSIIDINATIKPHFAIVDGITGMEGDGPIMGTPKQTGVLVMGRNLVAVDSTCSRIMGIDPARISYLWQSRGWLGPVSESSIAQAGEPWREVCTPYYLVPSIPAHQGIALAPQIISGKA
jgi:uncharacterized protein (DUF362 family)